LASKKRELSKIESLSFNWKISRESK